MPERLPVQPGRGPAAELHADPAHQVADLGPLHRHLGRAHGDHHALLLGHDVLQCGVPVRGQLQAGASWWVPPLCKHLCSHMHVEYDLGAAVDALLSSACVCTDASCLHGHSLLSSCAHFRRVSMPRDACTLRQNRPGVEHDAGVGPGLTRAHCETPEAAWVCSGGAASDAGVHGCGGQHRALGVGQQRYDGGTGLLPQSWPMHPTRGWHQLGVCPVNY